MTATFATAPTRTVDVNEVSYVYREYGPRGGTPVIFLHHLTGILDDWDPRVVDGIATHHHVVVFDNQGIGSSGGEAPDSVEQMAQDAIAFIRALGFAQVHLLGFSLGGFIAQTIALAHPTLVDRLVLAGTAPAGPGEQAEQSDAQPPGEMLQAVIAQAAQANKHPKHLLFFTQTARGQASADAFLARLQERVDDRDAPLSDKAMIAQFAAITRWRQSDPSALAELTQPTLIVNGDHDVMIPTARSFELLDRIANAQLSIYPDAGHGALFQYHDLFVGQVLSFLAQPATRA